MTFRALRLLLEQRVGHELVEDAAQDFVAAIGGNRAVVGLDVAEQQFEISLLDGFAVDPRQDVRQLFRDGHGRWRRRRRHCRAAAGCGRQAPGLAPPAAGVGAGIAAEPASAGLAALRQAAPETSAAAMNERASILDKTSNCTADRLDRWPLRGLDPEVTKATG